MKLRPSKLSAFKNPHIKIDLLLLLPRGQNPLSYYILYNESKHNIFTYQGKANKIIQFQKFMKGNQQRKLNDLVCPKYSQISGPCNHLQFSGIISLRC
jgi:hypothetical protein